MLNNHDNSRKSHLKGSQLGAFCPYAKVHCYLEFKLRYLKNLKLFSIRVQELFKPIVLQKTKTNKRTNKNKTKKGRRIFALFKSIFFTVKTLGEMQKLPTVGPMLTSTVGRMFVCLFVLLFNRQIYPFVD